VKGADVTFEALEKIAQFRLTRFLRNSTGCVITSGLVNLPCAPKKYLAPK
jgi:hypothetical protein